MSISSVRDTGVLAEFTGDQLGRMQTHPAPSRPVRYAALQPKSQLFARIRI
jgi:hypothetical protein